MSALMLNLSMVQMFQDSTHISVLLWVPLLLRGPPEGLGLVVP